MKNDNNIVRLVDNTERRLALPGLAVDDANHVNAARELRDLFAKTEIFFSNGQEIVFACVDDADMPRAVKATPEKIIASAPHVCRPLKQDKKGKLLDTVLPYRVANLYLRGLEGEWNLQTFRGITTSPLLRDDGTITHLPDGFDADTGLWCHNIPKLDVPEHPTEDDAREALRFIRHFFRTFCFADRESALDWELGVDVTDLDKPVGLDEATVLLPL